MIVPWKFPEFNALSGSSWTSIFLLCEADGLGRIAVFWDTAGSDPKTNPFNQFTPKKNTTLTDGFVLKVISFYCKSSISRSSVRMSTHSASKKKRNQYVEPCVHQSAFAYWGQSLKWLERQDLGLIIGQTWSQIDRSMQQVDIFINRLFKTTVSSRFLKKKGTWVCNINAATPSVAICFWISGFLQTKLSHLFFLNVKS